MYISNSDTEFWRPPTPERSSLPAAPVLVRLALGQALRHPAHELLQEGVCLPRSCDPVGVEYLRGSLLKLRGGDRPEFL